MLFKSVKCYLPRWASALTGLLGLAALSAGPVWAQSPSPSPVATTGVSITDTEPVTPQVNTNIGGTSGAWYAGSNDGTQPVSVDTNAGFHFFDFRASASTGLNSSPPDIIMVDVTLGTAPTGTLQTVIVAKITTGTAVSQLVPIACSGSNTNAGGCIDCYYGFTCQTGAPPAGTPNANLRWGARYNGNLTVRVGFYPKDICATLSSTTTIPGCAGSAVGLSTTGPATIPLTFYAVNEPDTITIPDPTQLTSGGDAFTLALQGYPSPNPSASPSPTVPMTLNPCPSPTPTNFYIPQDGGIKVNTDAFSASSAPSNSGGAPFDTLVAVGRIGGTPDTSSTGYTNNDLLSRTQTGNYQRISGINNTPPNGPDILYDIDFALRDKAGALTTFGCPLTGVQTAEVYGFLAQDKCFIATATFGSREAAPVQMLRQFRDKLLLTNDYGRLFVSWYYTNSPAAADWLEDHAWLRPVVLTAFLPVEFIVWLLLHPALAFPLAGMSLALLAFARRGVEA